MYASSTSSTSSTDEPVDLEDWLRDQFSIIAFKKGKFVGYAALKKDTLSHYPHMAGKLVKEAINK